MGILVVKSLKDLEAQRVLRAFEAKATATPGANKLLLSGGDSLIDPLWLGSHTGAPSGDDVLYGDRIWRRLMGSAADVQAQRTDANTITLAGMPGTSKLIWVYNTWVDLSAPLTIDTDGAGEYCVTGTTTVAKGDALNVCTTNGSDGNAYNAYGLFHCYLANNAACWGLAGYDRRLKLIISPNAPTADGYLAASGDGLNARYVTSFCCGSSRTMETVLCLVSYYNPYPRSYALNGVTGWTALTPDSGMQDLPNSECQFHAVMLANSMASLYGICRVRNNDTDVASMYSQIHNGNTALGNSDVDNLASGTYGYKITSNLIPAVPLSVTSTQVCLFKLRVNPTNGGQPNSTPEIMPSGSTLNVEITRIS